MMKTAVLTCIVTLSLATISIPVFADGTETLGPPSIPIASGTGIVAAGTGLEGQPGIIDVDVPGIADQVLLYWAGAVTENAPSDDTISVNGIPVTGSPIGGPAFFFGFAGKSFYYTNYRADISDLGLVGSGPNTLTIDGMDNKDGDGYGENSGAGILVIYEDGSGTADIELRDGLDLAFIHFPAPRQSTIPQAFTFPAAATPRTANLVIFAGSVGEEGRPNAISIAVDGSPDKLFNLLFSSDGALWDTLTLPTDIPAGATQLTVQLLSEDDGTGSLPASLNWVGAGLSIPPGDSGGDGCTPGYWKNHLESWPPTGLSPLDDFDTTFGVDYFDPDITLEGGVNAKGGGVKKVARHGTAALLNALHPDVSYPVSAADVIAAVQSGDVDALVGFNELSDECPAE